MDFWRCFYLIKLGRRPWYNKVLILITNVCTSRLHNYLPQMLKSTLYILQGLSVKKNVDFSIWGKQTVRLSKNALFSYFSSMCSVDFAVQVPPNRKEKNGKTEVYSTLRLTSSARLLYAIMWLVNFLRTLQYTFCQEHSISGMRWKKNLLINNLVYRVPKTVFFRGFGIAVEKWVFKACLDFSAVI